MALDSVLTVAALAAGASVTVPHTLSAKPNFIRPDRPTPIGVASATATSVTFTNYGNQTESAFFHATRDHSIQQAGATELFWQGYTGFTSFQLAAPQWEDLLVPLVSSSAFGVNPPRLTQVANNGAVVPGAAVLFNGAGGAGTTATIPDFGNFADTYGITFWVTTNYASSSSRNILVKTNTITVDIASGALRVQLSGMARQTLAGFILGSKNHVVISVTKVAAAVTLLQVWINNVLRSNVTFPTALAGDNVNAFAVGANNLAMTLDELRFYQDPLDAVDTNDLWNGGAGTEAEPNSTPTILAGYHCNEGAGGTADNYEGTAGLDMIITNGAWVAGLVGTPDSQGVYVWEFVAGEEMSLQFSAQMSHGWLLGSDYDVHLHWKCRTGAGAGNVVLGVELQRCSIGDVWPVTTTVYTVIANPTADPVRTHRLTSVVTLAGAGLGLSHIIRGRVFRDGTSGDDTFAEPILIDNVDFHYQKDTLGSRLITSK